MSLNIYEKKWDSIRKRKIYFCGCHEDLYKNIKNDIAGKIYNDLKVAEIDYERTKNSKSESVKRKII